MTDWEKADPRLVEQIVREGEIYLQSQLVLATSADQRAAVLGGIFSAASAALVAAILTASGTLSWPLLLAGALASLMFVGASALDESSTAGHLGQRACTCIARPGIS